MEQTQSQRNIGHAEMPLWWDGHIAFGVHSANICGE